MTQPVKFKQVEHLSLLGGQVPQVRVIRVPEHMGFTDTGDKIGCLAAVRFTLEDFPKHLLKAEYEPQLELGRWTRSKRTKDRNTGVFRNRGSGFKHPSDWTGTTTLNPHKLSNRGGAQHTNTPRPTAIDLVGVVPNAAFTLDIGILFAPWFRIVKVPDSKGSSIVTLRYLNGKGTGHTVNNDKGYPRVAFRGFFVFRYSVFNPGTNVRESGPWSDVVCAQPLRWPMKPSGNFPQDSEVCPTPGVGSVTLTASMTTTAKSS